MKHSLSQASQSSNPCPLSNTDRNRLSDQQSLSKSKEKSNNSLFYRYLPPSDSVPTSYIKQQQRQKYQPASSHFHQSYLPLNKTQTHGQSNKEQKQLNIIMDLSTNQQINQSIEHEKAHLNESLNTLYVSLSKCQRIVKDAFYVTEQLYQNMDKNVQQQLKGKVDYPYFDLSKVQYDVKCDERQKIFGAKGKYSHQPKIRVLEGDVQQLQKKCAEMYLMETQKLDRIERQFNDHFVYFGKEIQAKEIQTKIHFEHTYEKVRQSELTTKSKIQKARSKLGKFDEKILNIISKLQETTKI